MEFPDDGATVDRDYPGIPLNPQAPAIYVQPVDPIPAWIDDKHNGRHRGTVMGWRGTRCHVTYKGPNGTHMHWIGADRVERVPRVG